MTDAANRNKLPPGAPEALIQSIGETRQLLARAEQNLQRARQYGSHSNATELDYLLADVRVLHNRINTLAADVNREAIDQVSLSPNRSGAWLK